MNAQHPAKCLPSATYRLQFNRDFTFQQAVEIADYLTDLGISTVYASPLFQAGPESTHGYDVCSFSKISANLGGESAFERFTERLRELKLGLLLDVVPNHMGAVLSNDWWRDVLENGRHSPYAEFFDINWTPPDPSLRNKILLPVLEDHYVRVLESGKLRLEFQSGKFFIGYYDRKFPVAPATLAAFTNQDPQRALRHFNGQVGQPRAFDQLDALLQEQNYRLAYWRVGPEEINYRRFFDVSELVGLNIEKPRVFTATHERIFDWLRTGKISGLRIDHPDGLRNPKQYLERLQTRAAELNASADAPLYVVVEKILSGDEPLPTDWPVAGTTGYDFLNRVNGLFVNRSNTSQMTAIYEKFIGKEAENGPRDLTEVIYQSKERILSDLLPSELDALIHQLQTVAAHDRRGIDFTFGQLRSALKSVIAAWPVYRTYLTENLPTPTAQDLTVIQTAIGGARSRAALLDPLIFDWIKSLLRLEPIASGVEATQLARDFVMRLQQLTGPVMAKGLEDTAFYNYNRLISLNEVGGDPGRFGVSVEAFHEANAINARTWPHTLLATATHDTKRGEDARTRIDVLSEIPDEWQDAIRRWRDWNVDKKTSVNGHLAPTSNDEYFQYQTLIGALPSHNNAPDGLELFRQRTTAYLLKAIRESKANTSWTNPNPAYETAVQDFVARILTEDSRNVFLPDLIRFQRRVAFFGRFNSLAQTLLKITSPGVPDFYQGTELWDFSFVDPDNRRPVDHRLRRDFLAELKARFSRGENSRALCSELLEASDSGKIKLYTIWRALELRLRRRELFEAGTYTPLPASGAMLDHVCAFSRQRGAHQIIAVAPRLVCGLTQGREIVPCGLEIWNDTLLPLPPETTPGATFRNIFTQETLTVATRDGAPTLHLGEILNRFPVALLERS
ncbi:MAG: malto-oligosyltrehalose synthase [Verrucomicrobiota bacterium]